MNTKNMLVRFLAMASAAVVLGGTALAQVNSDITLVVHDNGSGADTLRWGVNATATNGKDAALGEEEQPPAPPDGVFDARWINVGTSNNFGQGVKKNYHANNASLRDTFRLKVQPEKARDELATAFRYRETDVAWEPVASAPAGSVNLGGGWASWFAVVRPGLKAADRAGLRHPDDLRDRRHVPGSAGQEADARAGVPDLLHPRQGDLRQVPEPVGLAYVVLSAAKDPQARAGRQGPADPSVASAPSGRHTGGASQDGI